MYVTPEQIQAANKANVEAVLAVANTQFTALEKLANIQASAVKSAFEDSVANTRSAQREGCAGVRYAAELIHPARHREGHRLLEERLRSRDRGECRAVQSGGAPCRRMERELRDAARQGFEKRAGWLGRRGRRGEVDAGRREFGLRQPHQGGEASDRDRRGERCRRNRDCEGPREAKKGRLSAKPGKTNSARSSAKRSRTKTARSRKKSGKPRLKRGFSFIG